MVARRQFVRALNLAGTAIVCVLLLAVAPATAGADSDSTTSLTSTSADVPGDSPHSQVLANWSAIGGYVTADPAVALDPQNASGVYLFVRGGDNSVYWQHSTDGTTWPGYSPAGGGFSSFPTAVSDAAGTSGTVAVYVFGRGFDGSLYYGKVVNGSWGGWQPLGGFLTSGATATVTSSGVWVAVRGGDGSLYTRHLQANAWSGWQNQGGYLSSTPFLAGDASGVHAFVAGGDNALYTRDVANIFSTWQNLGGYLTSPALAVTTAGGDMWVFVRGGDGAVYERHHSGSTWSPFSNLGGFVTSTVWPVAGPDGVSIFARGAGAGWQLYRNHFNGTSWQGWVGAFGLVVGSDPIAVVDATSRETVFAVNANPSAPGPMYTIAFSGVSGQGAQFTADEMPPGSRPVTLGGDDLTFLTIR